MVNDSLRLRPSASSLRFCRLDRGIRQRGASEEGSAASLMSDWRALESPVSFNLAVAARISPYALHRRRFGCIVVRRSAVMMNAISPLQMARALPGRIRTMLAMQVAGSRLHLMFHISGRS